MTHHHIRRRLTATLGTLCLVMTSVGVAYADEPETTARSTSPTTTANSEVLTTWTHENAVATTDPVAAGEVRTSPYYRASVATTAEPDTAYDSFVYMSVPRSGNGKIGYTEEDGAEFAADAELTMSWTSFEYATDVWVDVTLTTDQPITSADDVVIRPASLKLEKQLVDSSTIRVKVPYNEDGYRFSVEFAPQLFTAYNNGNNKLTTDPSSGQSVHTEPKNSMLVFANPQLSGAASDQLIPSEKDGTIYRPEPGLVNNLNDTTAEIIYFEPGVYYMGSDYHAVLPENVTWVYLAPGAYVKGAFKFLEGENQPSYKVTGYGVLSGEMYVYEPDTTNGYQHNERDNCHVDCVKMLQFESSNTGQTLDLHGITVANPPYHSFVIYAHENGEEIQADLSMTVEGYKQVGAWYWQTDGLELYRDSTMKNTFFHSNDDVLKLYHSNVTVDNTVIWKNENGPVVQWGWTPRDIDNVQVSDTDIIHNRMYWSDVKTNACVFNSSSHWEGGDINRGDPATTVKNMTFTDTRVEGAVNCAIRVYSLSNLENITIDGFAIDEWNNLPLSAQVSLFKRYTDRAGTPVTIGNEVSDGNGLSLHNYTVGGVPILKAGNNWADDELGRLGFDADTWEGWNATADDEPTGPAPSLAVDGLTDGSTLDSRHVTISGTSDAEQVTVRINGVETDAPLTDGTFAMDVTLPNISNRIVVTATGANGVMAVGRYTVNVYGTKIGELTDPTGDDNGPGSYTYPTDGAFNSGSFDLTKFQVFDDGDTIRFVTSVASDIQNPWGGNGMSTQRVNIYLRDGESTTTTPLLPGTNMSASGAWTHAIVAVGRDQEAQFGNAIFGSDLERISDVALDVDPSGHIITSVPASALAGIDLQNAQYQVSMLSHAELGEGIGNVRPVYSAECAQGLNGCPSWVGAYRIGGGAGEPSDELESKDTDTSDSNALDIISGEHDQASVMDWHAGAVVVPYVSLADVTPPNDATPVPTADGNVFFADDWAQSVARTAMKIATADEILVGDFNGDGVDTLALRTGNTYTLLDTNRSGSNSLEVSVGTGHEHAVVGDFNGDGYDDLALRAADSNRFDIHYNLEGIINTETDSSLAFGRASDVPVAGDWNGDGTDSLAVQRGSTFFVSNTLTGGDAETTFIYGRPGDRALAGDFDGDGADSLTILRGNNAFVRNSLSGGNADAQLHFGRTNDVLVAGDWFGEDVDTLAVYRP